jgi:hypothetical protein
MRTCPDICAEKETGEWCKADIPKISEMHILEKEVHDRIQ